MSWRTYLACLGGFAAVAAFLASLLMLTGVVR